ncbi:hypothetical protein B0H21DRAFT_737584 [Amylocystis lapponica]|nr:hypothetical protein B0H21DRAFT_737584 [Amylocystis lapponica]
MLHLYITTYGIATRDSLSWALVLVPSTETQRSEDKVSTLYCLAGQAVDKPHCHQRMIHSLKDENVVARMLIGRVHLAQKQALEQIISDTRHLTGSSLDWTNVVSRTVVGSGILKTKRPVDVGEAMGQLTGFSNEVQRGKGYNTRYAEVATIIYAGAC